MKSSDGEVKFCCKNKLARLDLVSLNGFNFALFIFFFLCFVVAKYDFMFITDLSVYGSQNAFLFFFKPV